MTRVLIWCIFAFFLFTQQQCPPKQRHGQLTDEWPAQETITSGPLEVMFYNVENLFDVKDDPETDDQQFLPTSEKQWNVERFGKKLDQLSKVIDACVPALPDIIGLAEVENRQVVDALSLHPTLRAAHYQVIHQDSPDNRGIDCALMYNPERVRVDQSEFLTVTLPDKNKKTTRDILYARAISGDDTLHVFVNHWPSRYEGQEITEPRRLQAAFVLKQRMDQIRMKSPDARILCMGDFNDYPNNKSLQDVLRAGTDERKQMFNYMAEMHKQGIGTYNYKGNWGTLDQFVGSWPLVKATDGFSADRSAARIFREDWMMYVNDRGEAYPNRTYGGPNYYGGFSDHLPIAITLQQH